MATSSHSNRTKRALSSSMHSRAGRLHQLLNVSQGIDEFANLEPGWDGDLTPALSGLVTNRAYLLMLTLEVKADGQIPPPAMSAPIADGGLQLEWAADHAQIEVQVAPDGTYGYLLIKDLAGVENYEEADDLSIAEITHVIQEAFSL